MTCSAYILIEPRTISPGIVPFTKGWALTHQSLIKKCYIGLPTQPDLMEAFHQLKFLKKLKKVSKDGKISQAHGSVGLT